MNIAVWGACGKMGRYVRRAIAERGDTFFAGVDRVANPAESIAARGAELGKGADAVIDFSTPDALGDVLAYCLAQSCPAVLAVTGYDEAQRAAVRAAAECIPILLEANLSVGVAVLAALVERAARELGGFDIEIAEMHHNRKADSPSGTALALADAAKRGRGEALRTVVGRRGPRSEDEIGIAALRGGTVVGAHTVVFAGKDETIALSHTALSRAIFADGAVTAAHALVGRPPALYRLRDLLRTDVRS